MAEDVSTVAENRDLYEAVQRRGAGPITAARIALAQGNGPEDGTPRSPYDRRTRKELYERARELGIAGRSRMTRSELIEALRAR